MITLPPLENTFLSRRNITSADNVISYTKNLRREMFDFDVWLPSYQKHLQRGFVWSLEQSQSLIESVMVQRFIPPLCLVQKLDDTYEVIDGKQRLNALLSYKEGMYDFCGYFYEELPKEYKHRLNYHPVKAHVIYDYEDRPVTDQDKLEWFKWVNFAGTPQDREYINGFQA